MEKNEKILKLVMLLEHSNDAYRTGDTSWFDGNGLIPPTDKKYDSMCDDLAVLEPDHPFLEKIGYEVPEDDSRKQPLPVPMLSADKIKTVDELRKWMSRHNIPPDAFAVLSAKLDGLSILVDESLQPGQEFKHAWTRGNGSIGQTSDAHFAAVEANFNMLYPFYSMGEAIISRRNYDLHFKGKINPRTGKVWKAARNIAAGRFNAGVPDQFIKYVDFIRFGLLHFDGTLVDKSKQFEEINKLNKVPIPYKTIRFRDITADVLDKVFKSWSQDYEIDGIIIDVDNADLREHLGIHTSGKYPNYMVAYKDDNEEVAETIVKDVAIQISKNGHGIPVALLEPTMLDGAEVKRATCNNMRFIVDNKIAAGAVIKIKRSGFVIPKIIDIVKPVDTTELTSRPCPICKSEMIWDEPNEKGELVHMCCSNPDCDGRKYKRLLSFFKTLEVENVGPGIVDAFYNSGYTTVKRVIGITMPALLSLDRFGQSKATKIYDSIAAKIINVPLSKLQHASGYFTGMGSKKLKLVNTFINENVSEESLTNRLYRNITREQIEDISGLGEKMADIYLNAIDSFWEWCIDTGLDFGIDFFDGQTKTIEPMSNTLNGMGVVFTGFRSEEMEDDVMAHGGVMKSGISKNVDILVMKAKGTGTSKETKAIDLGLEILTIDEFKNSYLV